MKEGWICPRCGKVNAPFAFQCACEADKQTTNAMSDDDLCPCGGLHDWVCLDGDRASSSSAFPSPRVVLARCSKCGQIKTFDVAW